MAVQHKRKPDVRKILLTILKVLYMILFALACVVLVLYFVFKMVVKPPEVEQDVEVTLPPAVTQPVEDAPTITDDPAVETTPEVVKLTRKEDFHTFLILGTDDGNGNADTIMVASYDVKNDKVSVLSVPRDTLVDVSRTVKKINGAYGAGGVDQLLDELEGVLGFRPDHYLKIDLKAFVAVVDQLGGLSFYVPEDMWHNDGAGFIIDLKQGTQWLNGEMAMQLVRYRGYQSADLGRIQTQQKFLTELAKQLVKRSSLSDVDDYAKILGKYLDTDLTITEIAWFGTQAFDMDFSNDITFATLPGDGSAKYKGVSWYYELFPDETRALIDSTVNPYTTTIPAQLQNIFQVP